jgi:hypothetical protein
VDPINYAEVSDYFTIVVHSSGDTLSSACGFADTVAIEEGTFFTFDQSYSVGAADAKYESKLVTNVLSGTENLSEDCWNQIFTSLDYLNADGVWESIAWENWIDAGVVDDYTMHNKFGVGLIRQGAFTYFTMQISEWEFEHGCQFEYDTTLNVVNIELRVAYREGNNVLASSNFVLTVTGTEKVSPCAEMTVEKESQAATNYLFAFNADSDFHEIHINNALKANVVATSAVSSECLPKYKFSVFDPLHGDAGAYVTWSAIREAINGVTDDQSAMIWGDISFDDWQGNVMVWFYQEDMTQIAARFADQAGDVKITCKVDAYLSGHEGSLA